MNDIKVYSETRTNQNQQLEIKKNKKSIRIIRSRQGIKTKVSLTMREKLKIIWNISVKFFNSALQPKDWLEDSLIFQVDFTSNEIWTKSYITKKKKQEKNHFLKKAFLHQMATAMYN